jgi:hypothetical protein
LRWVRGELRENAGVFGNDARFVVICMETTKAPELRTEFEGLVNRGDLGQRLGGERSRDASCEVR